MHFIEYNRKAVAEYAKKWAMGRNPEYYNFDMLGGDCTNFASQCLYAGIGVMNFTKDTGWYYISLNNRAAAWTGADYFQRFMLHNSKEGPIAVSYPVNQLEIGDFISLKNAAEFFHTLIVVGFRESIPLVAAHTNDAYLRPLYSYNFEFALGIHILGGNTA